MEKITREQILAALAKLRLPGGSEDIVSAGLISDIVIANNRVMFAITADQANSAGLEPLRREAERIVAGLPGVEKVDGGAHRRAQAGATQDGQSQERHTWFASYRCGGVGQGRGREIDHGGQSCACAQGQWSQGRDP